MLFLTNLLIYTCNSNDGGSFILLLLFTGLIVVCHQRCESSCVSLCIGEKRLFYPNGTERNMLLKAAKDSGAKHQHGDALKLCLWLLSCVYKNLPNEATPVARWDLFFNGIREIWWHRDVESDWGPPIDNTAKLKVRIWFSLQEDNGGCLHFCFLVMAQMPNESADGWWPKQILLKKTLKETSM